MVQHPIGSRLLRWSPGIILAVYALWVLLGCVESEWRPEWDSAIYILTARSLAEGTGYSYLGSPFFLRPPGFSYVLSFLFHGDRGFDFAQINFLMMLSSLAAVGIVYLALRRTEGQNRALGAVLLMATCPVFVSRFNWIQSDAPFLRCFSLRSFFLTSPSRNRGGASGPASVGRFSWPPPPTSDPWVSFSCPGWFFFC